MIGKLRTQVAENEEKIKTMSQADAAANEKIAELLKRNQELAARVEDFERQLEAARASTK